MLLSIQWCVNVNSMRLPCISLSLPKTIQLFYHHICQCFTSTKSINTLKLDIVLLQTVFESWNSQMMQCWCSSSQDTQRRQGKKKKTWRQQQPSFLLTFTKHHILEFLHGLSKAGHISQQKGNVLHLDAHRFLAVQGRTLSLGPFGVAFAEDPRLQWEPSSAGMPAQGGWPFQGSPWRWATLPGMLGGGCPRAREGAVAEPRGRQGGSGGGGQRRGGAIWDVSLGLLLEDRQLGYTEGRQTGAVRTQAKPKQTLHRIRTDSFLPVVTKVVGKQGASGVVLCKTLTSCNAQSHPKTKRTRIKRILKTYTNTILKLFSLG